MKVGDLEVKNKYIGYGILVLILLWAWSSYNGLVTNYETVQQKIAQVNNVNQRRYDLIPNLVATVAGYAAHEKATLTEVTQARASIGQIKLSPNMTPAQLMAWQKAQGDFSAALSKLMVVSERYPDLKANQNFRDLQSELAGTENRIATERRKWQIAVQEYNMDCKRFPGAIMAKLGGFTPAAYFESDAAAKTAPKVKFK